MIRNLDDVVEGVEAVGGSGDFTPVPKGTYNLELTAVKAWEPKVLKNVVVFEFDDKYQKVKNASGDDVKEKVKELTIYNTNLTFKIVDGDYAGRLIFANLSTHPNIPWMIPNLIHALGKPKLKLSQLNTLIGTHCMGVVDLTTYEKTIKTDDGFEDIINVPKNEIKRYKPIEIELDINEDDINDI